MVCTLFKRVVPPSRVLVIWRTSCGWESLTASCWMNQTAKLIVVTIRILEPDHHRHTESYLRWGVGCCRYSGSGPLWKYFVPFGWLACQARPRCSDASSALQLQAATTSCSCRLVSY